MTMGATLKKILIVEDDEYSRLVISRFLQSQGFHVITAENGFIGLVTAKEQKPDLIICDIKMPVMDGYAVLENLRKDPNTAKIPVFFITFYTDRENRDRAVELGANDYIVKPVNLDKLLRKINDFLE
jgi:CheY-like chemotaxis protein